MNALFCTLLFQRLNTSALQYWTAYYGRSVFLQTINLFEDEGEELDRMHSLAYPWGTHCGIT